MSLFEIDAAPRGYRAEDFETASIRSAAPSYVSEVPSYHTTVSNGESIPPYSPPANNNNNSSSSSNNNNSNSSTSNSISGVVSAAGAGAGSTHQAGPGPRTHSLRTLLPSNTAHMASPGLPPIPPAPRHSPHASMPTLHAFSIPSWSTVNANPTYQRVATRRAQAAMSSGEGLLRNAARALERVNEEGGGGGAPAGGAAAATAAAAAAGPGSGSGSGSGTGTGTNSPGDGERVRPLEDPYLVGEEAAARARRERLARENPGDEILHREDRRWDWFLAQQRDWDERERSWKQFRRSMGTSSGLTRGRLARRLVAGGR